MIRNLSAMNIVAPQNSRSKQNQDAKTHTTPSFKGNQAAHSSLSALSSMGKAQVAMNNKGNVAFKGKPPFQILGNLNEGRRAEALRDLSGEFAAKIIGHFPSEERFDNAVINCVKKGTNDIHQDATEEFSNLIWINSKITSSAKLHDHVQPKDRELFEYVKKHPSYKHNFEDLKTQRTTGFLGAFGAATIAIVSLAAMPVTAGASAALLAGVAGASGVAAGASSSGNATNSLNDLMRRARTEFGISCMNYKLKRLIAKSRIEVSEVVNIINRYK